RGGTGRAVSSLDRHSWYLPPSAPPVARRAGGAGPPAVPLTPEERLGPRAPDGFRAASGWRVGEVSWLPDRPTPGPSRRRRPPWKESANGASGSLGFLPRHRWGGGHCART